MKNGFGLISPFTLCFSLNISDTVRHCSLCLRLTNFADFGYFSTGPQGIAVHARDFIFFLKLFDGVLYLNVPANK